MSDNDEKLRILLEKSHELKMRLDEVQRQIEQHLTTILPKGEYVAPDQVPPSKPPEETNQHRVEPPT